jgi:hypothetical protein
MYHKINIFGIQKETAPKTLAWMRDASFLSFLDS